MKFKFNIFLLSSLLTLSFASCSSDDSLSEDNSGKTDLRLVEVKFDVKNSLEVESKGLRTTATEDAYELQYIVYDKSTRQGNFFKQKVYDAIDMSKGFGITDSLPQGDYVIAVIASKDKPFKKVEPVNIMKDYYHVAGPSFTYHVFYAKFDVQVGATASEVKELVLNPTWSEFSLDLTGLTAAGVVPEGTTHIAMQTQGESNKFSLFDGNGIIQSSGGALGLEVWAPGSDVLKLTNETFCSNLGVKTTLIFSNGSTNLKTIELPAVPKLTPGQRVTIKGSLAPDYIESAKISISDFTWEDIEIPVK